MRNGFISSYISLKDILLFKGYYYLEDSNILHCDVL